MTIEDFRKLANATVTRSKQTAMNPSLSLTDCISNSISISDTMSDSLPPAINTLVLDLLNKADLESVTPRILREGLESIQTAQKLAPPADESRHIPQDFDLSAHKKAVTALIKKLYNEVASANTASSSDVKPSVPESLPSSQSTPAPSSATSPPPPPPKTTIPLGGGLALPGLGGVRGSHASPSLSSSPSSNGVKHDTSGDAALATKLQQQQSSSALPTTRGSASNDSTPRPKKRKSKADADEIESDEDSDVEAAAASAASKSRKTSSSKKSAKTDKEKKPRAANPNNPFNRPVLLSPAMAEICGGGEVSAESRGNEGIVQLLTGLHWFATLVQMPRHGVVKQLWAYVKERELQNPNNRRQVSRRL